MPETPAVMLVAMPITFDSPMLLAIAMLLVAVAMTIALVRRATVPTTFVVPAGIGLALLALAAGGPRGGDDRPRVVAMVDLSASTLGAGFREEANLRRDVQSLIGDQPFSIIRFGDENERETRWTPPPPDTTAVILYSDGRFDPPKTSPPIFAVIAPELDRPEDAAVTSLERRGDRLVVSTTNHGPPREMEVTGVMPATRPTVLPGTHTMTFTVDPAATSHQASIARGDDWPANDELHVMPLPPNTRERWWVSQSGNPPGPGWRTFSPGALPKDPAAYLAASVIVLDNVDADAGTPSFDWWLWPYVRDLGGGLLILGGDRAFAAGGYQGTVIGELSPLASSPPSPAAHWTFLLDASGSMAGIENGTTRFGNAVIAATLAIAQLPPSDVVNVGRFSSDLQWLMRGKSARDVGRLDVPTPRGPTNLDAALRAVVDSLDKSTVNHIVLLTDGQVQLPALDALTRDLKANNARVHILAVGEGPGLDALHRLAADTGGSFAEEGDVSRWRLGLSGLLRQAAPRHWMTTPVNVRFTDLPPTTTNAWNRTWLKSEADALAHATIEAETVPMAARKNVGAGQVIAVAFRPTDDHVQQLASRVETAPRDPRLRVTWRADRRLVVELDAADATAPINRLSPTLVLTDPNGTGQTLDVPQTGPGRYVLSLPAPRAWGFATLREGGRVIDRFAVPGRYGPEVDGIGNDRTALAALASRTGGKVIEPEDRGPIALPRRSAHAPLNPYFAIAGAVLVAMGLVAWRVKA